MNKDVLPTSEPDQYFKFSFDKKCIIGPQNFVNIEERL